MWWSDPLSGRVAPRRRCVTVLVGVALSIGLAACGFQPLYGTKTTRDRAVAELSSVAIDPIPDRIGQLVRNNLVDRIHTRGRAWQPRYRLKVDLSLSSEGLAVRSDDVITRRNLILAATYRILNGDGSYVLFEGQTFSVAAYNVGDSEFANLSAERDARVRTAREVSEEIKNQVVYFVRRNAGR
jgi:LPS-assembly lipoprotein